MPASDLPIKPDATIHHEHSPTCDAQLNNSFAAIDWHAPWLSHIAQLDYLRQTVEYLSNTTEHIDEMNHSNSVDGNTPDIIGKVLKTAMAKQADDLQQPSPNTKPAYNYESQTLQFVSQSALPEGEAYEHFIGTTGHIPTRDNLHDLFNGSIWLTFPKTKALLNHYHMLEIAAQGISETRGRVRDTITVFDENGTVLVTAEHNIGEALIGFDWQASLVTPRAKWDKPKQLNSHAEAAVYIFGHALLEQLIQPRKPLCAHSIVIHVTQEFFALSLSERMGYLDDKVAQYMDKLLSKNDVTPRQLAPLPILGVPHFWPENADPSFYDDNHVFRSGRRQKNK